MWPSPRDASDSRIRRSFLGDARTGVRIQRTLAGLLALVAVMVAGCTMGTADPTASPAAATPTSTQTPSPAPTRTPSATPIPTALPTPSPGPTPAPLTIADAAGAYTAAAQTYVKAMKAADAGWPTVWRGTRFASVLDPCDQSSVMNASIRAFRTSLAKEANAISAFIEDVEAIKFPTAALAADNSCLPSVSADAVDVKALTLAADVCGLRAAAVGDSRPDCKGGTGQHLPADRAEMALGRLDGSPRSTERQYAQEGARTSGAPGSRGGSPHPYKEGRF